MALNNNTYLILEYLAKFENESLISNERAFSELNLSQQEFSNAVQNLKTNKLVDGGKTHLSLSTIGRSHFETMKQREVESIYATIFDDFEFTVFNFFYNRGGKVFIEDIPKIIKDSVPIKKGINDGPMMHYLFSKSNYFNETNRVYELNDLGEAYYFRLLKRQKENELGTSNIVNQTTIHTGSGSIVTTGNLNTIYSQNISKGDIINFATELKNNKISQADIDDIIEIVKTEEPSHEKQEFGHKTKAWMGKMIQKSIDGTWEIGIATAGGVLVELLKKFYGM